MSYSPITGTGSGVAPVVNLTWPWLDKANVKARVNGADVALTWTGPSQVTFAAVVGNGAAWMVYRDTPVLAPATDFTDNSVLTAADLDRANLQHLYHEQEAAAADITQGLIPTNTFVGNNLLYSASALALTAAQAAAMLPLATNAAKGLLLPLDNNAAHFLRGDGAWATPPVNTGPQGPPGNVLADGDYGDISASGGVLSIDPGVVTLAKQANMATASVVYRKSASAGPPEVQSLATLKTDLGLTGINSGDQTITLTGDVTGSGSGSFGATIAANAVSYAKMQDVSATARFIGRITAGAGDPEELTGTQATTLLDSFTSALKGLAPASGGGTTNFLRADGTWAAPPGAGGSPGGASGNLQYNNAGAFAGASRLNLNASGNLALTYASTSTAPAADALEVAPQRIGATNGIVVPAWRTQGGVFFNPQRSFARHTVVWLEAQGLAGALSLHGLTALTALGTLTGPGIASTNRATRMFAARYTSAGTAGSTAGLQNTASHNYWTVGTGTATDGGGFYASFRWTVGDAAAVAGAHMFVGMTSNTVAPVATTNPNTFTDSIGVAQLNGGANLNIVYGGSAAQASIDLGANFPAANSLTDEYRLELWAPPDANNHVYYRVERLNTGHVAEGDLTGVAGTALPASTTFLGPRMYRSNNATALAVRLLIASFAIESDL